MSASGLPAIRGSVLVLGDVMEDVIVRPSGPMVPGSDVRAEIDVLPGGSGANQAMWLGALGVPTRFVGRVGRADLDRHTGRFADLGVTALLAGDESRPTGRLVTLVDADGERSFFTDRAANLNLSPADIVPGCLSGVGLVHISGYALFEPGPRAAALALMRAAHEAGAVVSLDPASAGFLAEVGVDAFRAWTAGVDLLFPNAQEAELLTGRDEAEAQIRALGAAYGLVVLKRGAEGAMAGTHEGVLASVPAPQTEAIDTTGAGDAFLAGFLAAMRFGLPLEACLTRGNAAGAGAAAQLGGQPR